jgi:hypothetical protein
MTSEELEVFEQRRIALKSSVDSLGAWLVGFIVAVVAGLGIELYRPIVSLLDKFDLATLVELIGTALVTLGVTGELAVEWKTHRNERELLRIDAVIEREDKRQLVELNLLAEQERLARVKLEEKLLRTVGPRKVTPEQRERIAARLRLSLSDVPLIPVLITSTLNAEDMAECTAFAWQISDALSEGGKEAPVYIVPNSFPWETSDISVRVPPPNLDKWGNLPLTLLLLLREEKFKLAGSRPVHIALPPDLFRTERNDIGASVPTPAAINGAIGIVIASRSPPVFRLEDL